MAVPRPHYWVVDLRNRLTHIMSQPIDGDCRQRAATVFGCAITVPGTERTIVID